MEYRFSQKYDKVAAFDLDYTLLKPIGKNTFAKDRNDAKLVFPEISKKLDKLIKDGYKIVIFTNQKGIPKKTSAYDIYYKIDTFLSPKYDVFMAINDDHHRKPAMGMYDKFIESNGKPKEMFYVGDGAGRKSDFSDSDRKFALNCGISFYTPEEFFLGKKEDLPKLDLLKRPTPIKIDMNFPEKSVIIMVGAPASGKSSLSQDIYKKCENVVIVNNDTTKSANKSFKLFKKSISDNVHRIVVDNTNGSKKNREQYILFAKNQGYTIYIIHFILERKYCEYLNWYRMYTQKVKRIPQVAYHTFYKRFEAPNTEEGVVIKYVPNIPEKVFCFYE